MPDGEEPVVLATESIFCNVSSVICSNCEKHPVTTAQFILNPETVDKYLWEDTPEGRVLSSEKVVIGKLRRGECRGRGSRSIMLPRSLRTVTFTASV